MKTYVFITRRICTIGGAEQYIYNKTKYLESRGWRVLIFSGLHGEILIDDFKRFRKYIYTPLYYSPSCFRKREVEIVLNKMAKEIQCIPNEECIIESDYLSRAIWAELLASRLKCRHLAFILAESHGYEDEARKFLRFKYDRHELAGIAIKSIRFMLEEDVALRDDTKISAYCNNVFGDCPDKLSDSLDKGADYTLGYFGRLEKACVPAIVDGFRSYALQHLEKFFNVVMMGDESIKGKKKSIRERLKDCNNVNLIFTGYLYPVPISFASKIDVYVSTAGAAAATYKAGFPTVKVNPLSGIPVGVMGLDDKQNKISMFDSNNDFTIPECIDKAINHRKEIVFKGGLGEEYYIKMNKEFDRQLSFVNNINKNDYYNEKLLRSLKTPRVRYHLVCKFMGHVLGGDGLERFRRFRGKE